MGALTEFLMRARVGIKARAELFKAGLVLIQVKYHGKLEVLIPINLGSVISLL